MKYLYTLLIICFTNGLYAQNYPNLLNYNLNSTHAHGIKIKTNLPFIPSTQMPTIQIKGYNFGTGDVISLDISYYIYSGGTDYSNPSNYYLYAPVISSSGSYTPRCFISNENGKVVIYLDDKVYYQRFTVSAFAQGMAEVPSWFQGWTVVDEPLTGTNTAEVPYKNRFKGTIHLPENGIWNAQGNVGIGTTTPTEKLSVNGKIRAHEIKVEAANWPDYVFNDDYKKASLSEIEQYIKVNKRLPDVPSAKEVAENGIQLGEMNKILLQKIEELTLHLIENEKKLKIAQNEKNELADRISKIENLLSPKK